MKTTVLSQEEELELVEKAIAGENVALNKLSEAHLANLTQYIHVKVKIKDDADDIVQKTLMASLNLEKLEKYYKSYTKNFNYLIYLKAIANGHILHFWRDKDKNISYDNLFYEPNNSTGSDNDFSGRNKAVSEKKNTLMLWAMLTLVLAEPTNKSNQILCLFYRSLLGLKPGKIKVEFHQKQLGVLTNNFSKKYLKMENHLLGTDELTSLITLLNEKNDMQVSILYKEPEYKYLCDDYGEFKVTLILFNYFFPKHIIQTAPISDWIHKIKEKMKKSARNQYSLDNR